MRRKAEKRMDKPVRGTTWLIPCLLLGLLALIAWTTQVSREPAERQASRDDPTTGSRPTRLAPPPQLFFPSPLIATSFRDDWPPQYRPDASGTAEPFPAEATGPLGSAFVGPGAFRRRRTVRLPDVLHSVDGVTSIDPADIASMAAPRRSSRDTQTDAGASISLRYRLDALAWDCETGDWARDAAGLVRAIDRSLPSDDGQSITLLDRLEKRIESADILAEELGPTIAATRVLHTRNALRRRLDVWRAVVDAGGERATAVALTEPRASQLLLGIDAVEQSLGNSALGQSWCDYMHLNELRARAEAASRLSDDGWSADDDRRRDRELARFVLRRMDHEQLSREQRELLQGGPFLPLREQLNSLSSGPVDFGSLLGSVERFEQANRPRDAAAIAEACARLEVAPVEKDHLLGHCLAGHYRNANVRIAVTGDLLNRLIPKRGPLREDVNDRVLGHAVRGASTTETEVSIRLQPDPSRLTMALEIQGRVSASTQSTASGATFRNDTKSTYRATKKMRIDMAGLHLSPADVSVENDTRLRSVETDYDAIPLVRSLAREVARSQHEQSRSQANEQTRQKIRRRAQRQFDEESDERLGRLNEQFMARIIDPLNDLSLDPRLIDAQTTDHRLTMRLRLAGLDQVSAHTPRPWAPSDSVASVQIHQSAFGNVVRRLDLDGATLTLAELRQRVAERLNLPNLLGTETENDDVVIAFAPGEAVTIRFQEGAIQVSLAIISLRKGFRRWNNFRVVAYYRPVLTDSTARLARDGVVQLLGRMNYGSQITVRGIFSKVFSRNQSWDILPPTLGANPAAADLRVTQFVIEDGWLAVALGPRSGSATPTIARQDTVTIE